MKNQKKQNQNDKKFEANYNLFKATKPYVGSLDILYDPNLSVHAKLLFQAITGLSFKLGYCYASNHALAQRLSLSETTIKKYMKELDDQKIIRKEPFKTMYGMRRKIYVEFDELIRRYKAEAS